MRQFGASGTDGLKCFLMAQRSDPTHSISTGWWWGWAEQQQQRVSYQDSRYFEIGQIFGHGFRDTGLPRLDSQFAAQPTQKPGRIHSHKIGPIRSPESSRSIFERDRRPIGPRSYDECSEEKNSNPTIG